MDTIDEPASPSAISKPRRRWFQFSLRTLLIFSALISFAAAWYGNHYLRIKKRDTAVKNLQSLGCKVIFDYELTEADHDYFPGIKCDPEPLYTRWLFGEHANAKVKWVWINSDANILRGGSKDEDFRWLADFPALELVTNEDKNIPPKTVERIVKYAPRLRAYYSWNASVDDHDMEQIGKLTDLTLLKVQAKNVTEKGYNHLSKLKKLQRLEFINGAITNNTLQKIGELPELRELQLYACQFVNTDFRHLNDLKILSGLRLSDTNTTDHTVSQIALALPHLSWLHLDGTSITEASLHELTKFSNLKAVSLPKHLSKEAVKNFTDRFPNCSVSQQR